MSTRQLFNFVTSTTIEDTPEAESQALDDIIAEVEANDKQLGRYSEQQRREQKHQQEVDNAVFMSSFLPRSLNQVADYDIAQIQKGRAEEGYASAVAALTGNKAVIDAVAVNYNTDRQPSYQQDKTVSLEVNESNSNIDEEETLSGDDEDEIFIKRAMTPEELEAKRIAIRNERRANKKKVKEERAEKRKIKIKKKDKKRAINKAKNKK